jgi:mono/diheme cytochrome c family protein
MNQRTSETIRRPLLSASPVGRFAAVSLLALASMAFRCEAADELVEQAEYCTNLGHVTYRNTVEPILVEYCSDCHSAGAVNPQEPTFLGGEELTTDERFDSALRFAGATYMSARVDAGEMPGGGTAGADHLRLWATNGANPMGFMAPFVDAATSTYCDGCHASDNGGTPGDDEPYSYFAAGTDGSVDYDQLLVTGAAEIAYVTSSGWMPPWTNPQLDDDELAYLTAWRDHMRENGTTAGLGRELGAIETTGPDSDQSISEGGSLDISYDASRTDGASATLVVFLDQDDEGMDGSPIVGCLPLGAGTATWTASRDALVDIAADFAKVGVDEVDATTLDAYVYDKPLYVYTCQFDDDNQVCSYARGSVTISP